VRIFSAPEKAKFYASRVANRCCQQEKSKQKIEHLAEDLPMANFFFRQRRRRTTLVSTLILLPIDLLFFAQQPSQRAPA
jgi:hypothetical protein